MLKIRMKYYSVIFALITVFPFSIHAEEEWVVSDIRISGLQRVSAGSIFNVMPVAVGDMVDTFAVSYTHLTLPTIYSV